MNYGELKQAVMTDTHRSDLVLEIPRFVRQCEGLIRRKLLAYSLNTIITNSNRWSGAIYDLPIRVNEIRSISLVGRQGDALTRVSPLSIRRLDTTADVLQYSQYNDRRIEFRGTPSDTDVFDLLYFGVPVPFENDTDTNDLLTDHESLYMAGSKFFVYIHTQDRELASDELDMFMSIIDTLNEQAARQISGATVSPHLNFAGGSSY